jgi:hypothetical protein
MNASFLKSLQSSGLRGCKPWFHPAFGENPPSAPGLNQQEFNTALARAVTNRSDLPAPCRQS